MTEPEIKKYILSLIKKEVDFRTRDYIITEADRAASITGYNVWNSLNPEDGIGGMSLNPYNKERTAETADRYKKLYEEILSVYDYAVEKFI